MTRFPHLFLAPALILAGCAQNSEQLACPTPETGRLNDTIRETPAQIAQAGEALGRAGRDEIVTVAAAVRARHPAAPPDAVVNYLVTAYCPRINQRSGLSRQDKATALATFSAEAERVTRQASGM